MTADTPTRRTVLTTGVAAAGAAAGTVVLAACSSGSTGSSSSNAGSGNNSNSSPSASASASGTVVAALNDITVGSAKSVEIGGQKAIVARPTAESAKAFSAICTHQGCTVAPSGGKLNCPCHGSVFNALTGAVEKGPAKQALPSISVKVENGNVVTA